MEVTYEIKVLVDGVQVYRRELKVEDGDKEIIKSALLAGVEICNSICVKEVAEAIDAA